MAAAATKKAQTDKILSGKQSYNSTMKISVGEVSSLFVSFKFPQKTGKHFKKQFNALRNK